MPTVAPSEPALAPFHPVVAGWFAGRFGEPTEIQRLAWPRIAAGEHLLITAPTGSGKTLTAFLWALDRLLTGAWPGERVRVLYVSPLRALNNDIQRNLLGPLAELEESFAAAGEPARRVEVATRSGDTPPQERQRMLRHPPEILITTPESLNILLTSQGGRTLLGGVRAVLLDEVHALAASKRGTHLLTAVERLVPLAGEFQRVALSATIRPLERVARMIGGWRLEPGGGYRRREVGTVRSAEPKRYDLEVVFPAGAAATADAGAASLVELERAGGSIWDPLVGELKRRVRRNRSTLLFANSRRTTERVTRLLNEEERSELAYSHHGSLSREIRAVVEERLKEGRLQAIVATNSLELGIDVGALDEVALIQTPPTIASAVQRIGRAGHGVGEVSRGRLYPLFGRDLLDAAVVAKSVLEQDIEAVRPVTAALDVLAQVLVSMTAAETWDVDDLFAFLRTTDAYHDLPRRQFDLVLEMLAGRYADGRLRDLFPRISIDRVDNRVRARRGAARLVYQSGGTIPDRGYFHLRHSESMAKIGELDEEFVWERAIGDTFTLGAQSWRIRAVTHNDVLVTPARQSAAMAPFWRAEERNRSFHLSQRIGELLETVDTVLAQRQGAAELRRYLGERHAMDAAASAELVSLLERQRAACGGALPHRRRIVVEQVADPDPRSDRQLGRRPAIFHTFWGGRVNRPFAIALAGAWQAEHGYPLEIEHDNDAIAVNLPEGFAPERLFELVRPDNLEPLLRHRLATTGFFGARFRENAGRALLLPRGGFRRRVPLWFNRQRAKKLLETVGRYDDFPIVLETWRTCLQDEFELDSLRRVLDEVAAGEIRLAHATTATPSPFAGGVVWKQTNRWMYEDDTPEGERPAGVRGELLRELVFSSQLRPRLPAELVERFRRKLQRVFPGYAPRDAAELLDWVKERLAIPRNEWLELLAAVERERAAAGEEPLAAVPGGGIARATAAGGPAPEPGMPPEPGAAAGTRAVPEPEMPPEPGAAAGGRAVGESVAASDVGGAGSGSLPETRLPPELAGKLVGLRFAADGEPDCLVAVETLPRLGAALAPTAEAGAGASADGEGPAPAGATGAAASAGSTGEALAGLLPAALASAICAPAPPYGPPADEAVAALARLAASQGATLPGAEEAEAPGAVEPPAGAGAPPDPLAELLAEWLRFYGPVREERLLRTFGLDEARARGALEALVADERIVIDQFVEGVPDVAPLEICDGENLERLLRLLRAEARPAFEALPLARLPLLLADVQGLTGSLLGAARGAAGGDEGLKSALERLFGYPAPAGLWEGDLLPARLDPYYTAWLDGLMQESDLVWLGQGREKLTFALAPDLELFLGAGVENGEAMLDPAAPEGADATVEPAAAELFGGEDARYPFEQLLERAALDSPALGRRLWDLAWRGEASNTTFLTVRQGLLNGFKPIAAREPTQEGRPPAAGRRRAGRGPRFRRWRSSRPFAGEWFRLAPETDAELDALDREELNKERVRVLLERYGVLFRELLAREAPALRWAALFRSLRLMELSGEILAGRFFEGIPGLQFASPAAFRRLREGLPDDAVYWLNALDPASPCGLGLDDLKGELPPRLPSTHLVFHGDRRVVVSRRHGGELDLEVGPEHPDLERYLGFLRVLLTRAFNPRRSVTVETINGEPAVASPYAARLARMFHLTRGARGLRLRRRY